MASDIMLFYQKCDPMESLPSGDSRYVPCESVRGKISALGKKEDVISRLAKEIRWSPIPVCRLLAGHRGAGKSTELKRLTEELENPSQGGERFFVVYFEADKEDIDVNDVDFPDLLLAIVRQLGSALREIGIDLRSNRLSALLDDIKTLAGSEVEFQKLDFDAKIAKFTAAIKNSPTSRQLIRQALEPRASSLLQATNELIGEAAKMICNIDYGYKNLVLIVDNLDRIVLRELEPGRNTHSRFFIDRGEQLKALNCPVVYTLPISMVFSAQSPALISIYGRTPDVLPMVKLINRDESVNPEGLAVMRQVVLARLDAAKINHNTAFDSTDTLDYLCKMSGGHLRNLLILLRSACLNAERLPIEFQHAKSAVLEMGNGYERALTKPGLIEAMRQIDKTQQLSGSDHDQMLLHYLYVLKYPNDKVWYALNPAIRELDRL